MNKTDDIFWKQFGIIVLLLTVFGFAIYFLANRIGDIAFNDMQNPASAIASRIAPFGHSRIGDPSQQTAVQQTEVIPTAATGGAGGTATDSGALSGADVYSTTCFACHGTGAANAPKLGDMAAWEPRVAKGLEELVNSALIGKGLMPAKGGATHLSDADVRNAVEFMLRKMNLGDF